jgi:hypothetical protein
MKEMIKEYKILVDKSGGERILGVHFIDIKSYLYAHKINILCVVKWLELDKDVAEISDDCATKIEAQNSS